MNESELRAYGLVAKAIANHAFAMASPEQPGLRRNYPEAPPPIYFTHFTSAFEQAASDLSRLGIFRPLDQGRGNCCFAFDCEIDESNNLAGQNWRRGPTFAELMITFINLFGEFGSEYWGFSSKPDIPFGAGSRIATTLDALASLGYLTKTAGGYVWTDRIEPIMLESYEAIFWSNASS